MLHFCFVSSDKSNNLGTIEWPCSITGCTHERSGATRAVRHTSKPVFTKYKNPTLNNASLSCWRACVLSVSLWKAWKSMIGILLKADFAIVARLTVRQIQNFDVKDMVYSRIVGRGKTTDRS